MALTTRQGGERQVVLKQVNYFEDGTTPFDAVHAATAATRGLSILPSDGAYGAVNAERGSYRRQ